MAMFAPVHEVSRYIHVINAYCREAEVHHDPLQNTLWDVLDQLIDVHTNVAPRSLFAGEGGRDIEKLETQRLNDGADMWKNCILKDLMRG